MGGPLDGVRILDLSQWQQGPYATTLLSDLGASVIKVERPGYGDAGRHSLGGYDATHPAPDFFAHNRGKRGITVDLRHPRGRELALELATSMDVVVSNFRHGIIEQWGLGYEEFRARNPRLIYAYASGTGDRGPEAGRPMFDIVAQALGGIMSVNGEEGTPPTPVGTFMGDQIGAMWLAVGILGALVAREQTGEGQRVDVSLLGAQVALQSFEITHYLFHGELPRRAGRGHPQAGILWNTFPASDGYFAMAGVREDRWSAFADLVGAPELGADPRFDTPAHRNEHRGPLLARLDAIFCTRPVREWMELLATIDIACGPVQDYSQVATDPQVLANEYVREMDHPHMGPIRYVNTPIRFSDTPVVNQGAEPVLGQHTEEVLLELGYDWPQITELREQGAI
ncbi:MAG: CoA transferase [Chloroflexi bacterium]|nr:CoA transferase [Chloroflexota bacterium]